MSKVIITGSAGFIGNHMFQELYREGVETYGYDITTVKRYHDICDYDMLSSIVEEGDKILNLAAVSRFDGAERNPREAWRTNVHGTATLSLVAAQNKAERIVHASTGSVYMPVNPDKVPIDESHPSISDSTYGGGNSVYGITKSIGELPVMVGSTPWIILRYAHIYGPGKEKTGAVGSFVDRMRRGLKPKLFGGLQGNDMTYINDIVQANMKALFTLDEKAMNQVYNIGTGEEITTEDAFKTMRKVFGYRKEFEREDVREVDASKMVFDISKARELLDYEPKFTFEEGLKDMKKNMK